MIREKIFEEIRWLELKSGDIWDFKKIINFINKALNPLEKKEFDNELIQLCNEGVFESEGKDTNLKLKLTELGEKIIYSK